MLHRLLQGGAALTFVKPLAQSWAASAMRLEGESSDEAGGAMQSWRDGDRQTDGQPERGAGAGQAEAEARPGPPSSALAAPDAGANVLGD